MSDYQKYKKHLEQQEKKSNHKKTWRSERESVYWT